MKFDLFLGYFYIDYIVCFLSYFYIVYGLKSRQCSLD